MDAVTFFDEDTPRELIAAVLPDVLVKGADWSHFIAGREEVEAAGGKVLTLPLEPGYSTTNIVEEILKRDRRDPSRHSRSVSIAEPHAAFQEHRRPTHPRSRAPASRSPA